MKRYLLMATIFSFTTFTTLVLAHKQECTTPVHQLIAIEAFGGGPRCLDSLRGRISSESVFGF